MELSASMYIYMYGFGALVVDPNIELIIRVGVGVKSPHMQSP
jgi:hypothetical protein